jgi:hypothetical protein
MTQKQQHPITPPPELVEKWWDLIPGNSTDWKRQLCTQAAQWGADQELEACCEWVRSMFSGHPTWADELRVARHPKPPSLKEQALALLDQHEEGWRPSPKDWDTIRTAIEALPNG